ncbi:AraC family transcriptional regulator [Streptosporangium nondiastaticum]|uniref:AraC family transcriptional regulator n=1 Tax=Streptosporangium nondiastaticum TaxID=35764 RepID=A0A9X7PGC7_9ACTN|nr:helix-turn-helix domain-containing protein [Streptosporangium nondiastaticum]PSJ26827.1 AraC family transcriptional regulator [Streptosporangium nondiastaticum]
MEGRLISSYRALLPEVVAVRPPHPRLAGSVMAYVGLDLRLDSPLRRRSVASATPMLMIDFETAGRQVSRLDGSGDVFLVRSPVSGVLDAPVDVELSGHHFGMGVSLTPPGAFALLDLPMHELAGTPVRLADIIGEHREQQLIDQLASAPSWSDRFDLLDRFLPALLTAGPDPSDAVVHAWQRLNATSGRTLISALADDIGVRRRRLEALFREQVGVTPKALARILRFHRALRLIADETRDTGLAAVAAACGYSDQAHLTREIRALSGTTPRGLCPRVPSNGRAHSFKSAGQAPA